MMIFLDQNSLSCFKVNLILIAKRKIHVISVMIIRSLIKNVCKSYICAHQVLILTYYSKISKLKKVSQLIYINRKSINFLRKLWIQSFSLSYTVKANTCISITLKMDLSYQSCQLLTSSFLLTF